MIDTDGGAGIVYVIVTWASPVPLPAVVCVPAPEEIVQPVIEVAQKSLPPPPPIAPPVEPPPPPPKYLAASGRRDVEDATYAA